MPTTLYQMRALRKISHDNILRVPGDTNTQDFWVDSTTRDLLVNLGFAQIINAGAAQPVLSTPLSSLTLLSQAGVPQKVVGSDGQDVALPGASSAVVGAADYATLVSTYPPASNAGKQAYTTNDSQFWNCNGTTWASASGGSDAITYVAATSLTTSATPTAGAAVPFAAAACKGMYVKAASVPVEYQRGGAGSWQQIAANETKLILGITDASQIGIRRSDYATARNTQTSGIGATLVNTSATYSCANLQCVSTSNSTYQAFAAQACVAMLLRNLGRKDVNYKINSGTTLLLRRGEARLVTGITNANQVSIVAFDNNGGGVVQGETFDAVPPASFQLTTLGKTEYLSNVATLMVEDMGSYTPDPVTIPMFAPFTRWKRVPRSISIWNTAANAVVSGGTTADTALANDETYATWGPSTQWGTSTAVTNTFTGSVTTSYMTTVNTATPIDVTNGDIHVTMQRVGTGGTVSNVYVDLFSSGSPGAPASDYHTLTVTGDIASGLSAGNGFGARSFSASLFTAVGVGANLSAITYARLRVAGTAGLVVRPGEVAFVKRASTKGSLVITFDDNHSAAVVNALAAMAPNGFPGVLFPSPAWQNTGAQNNANGNITVDGMLALQHKFGWQVGMQDYRREQNVDMTGYEWLLEQQKNLLMGCSLGFDLDGQRDGSYYGGGPYYITGEQTKAMQRIHASACQFYSGNGSLGDGLPATGFCDTNPPGDPWTMRRINISTWGSGAGSANNVYIKLKSYVDQAIATKGIAVLASHGDLVQGELMTAFSQLCAYARTQVDAGTLQVVTLRELRRQSQLVV